MTAEWTAEVTCSALMRIDCRCGDYHWMTFPAVSFGEDGGRVIPTNPYNPPGSPLTCPKCGFVVEWGAVLLKVMEQTA